jgi:hypothetical protein
MIPILKRAYSDIKDKAVSSAYQSPLLIEHSKGILIGSPRGYTYLGVCSETESGIQRRRTAESVLGRDAGKRGVKIIFVMKEEWQRRYIAGL